MTIKTYKRGGHRENSPHSSVLQSFGVDHAPRKRPVPATARIREIRSHFQQPHAEFCVPPGGIDLKRKDARARRRKDPSPALCVFAPLRLCVPICLHHADGPGIPKTQKRKSPTAATKFTRRHGRSRIHDDQNIRARRAQRKRVDHAPGKRPVPATARIREIRPHFQQPHAEVCVPPGGIDLKRKAAKTQRSFPCPLRLRALASLRFHLSGPR